MRRISPKFFGVLMAGFLLWSISSGAQQPSQKTSPTGPPADFHYYRGDVRVEMSIARDELAVVPGKGARAALAGIAAQVPGGEVDELRSGGALVRFATPAPDRASLSARARGLRNAGGVVAAVAYPAGRPPNAEQRAIFTNRFSLKLPDGISIGEAAGAYGLRVIQEIEYSERTYVVETLSDELLAGVDTANALYEGGLAEFASPLVIRQQHPRLIPNDPLFNNQWHLRNTGQVTGAVAGNDVNIVGAWDSYTGLGVNIAVSDSGVLVTHEDLAPNARTDIDIDINGGDDDPTPQFFNHGTNVAGIAAARGSNGLGVTGAAPRAGIVGIRLIEDPTTDQDEADAMNHQVTAGVSTDLVHINSNSWGPTDCGCALESFGPLTEAAIINGVTNGRGGKGVVYVWAAGNGREELDNVNYDGYASSRYTIAVGATGADGVASWYSEPGASMLVNTPSSDDFNGTTTTDFLSSQPLVTNSYSGSFGGTSSAAPLAAGIIALMLQANPELGWRDVQHVLVETAEKNDPANSQWKTNGLGRTFNVNYGFGRVDAAAAVARAASWVPVPAYATPVSVSKSVSLPIPDNNGTGVSSAIVVSGAPADFFIEHIEVTPQITHTFGGDLFIVLTAPSGRKSILAGVHSDVESYLGWKLTTVADWGENPNGTWTLTVKDLVAADTGTFHSWLIQFHGFQMDFSNIFVDPAYTSIEQGTANLPYNTMAEGLSHVTSGGTLHLRAGTYTTSGFSTPLHIAAYGGTVTLQAP